MRRLLEQILPNRVHEVGFSKPGTPIEKEGIVGPRRGLGYGQRGGVGKLI